MATTRRHEVHLAIYDLSRGMARSLSSQVLGPNHAIDIIPHTGIVVYGKEYLFGSMGIDSVVPSEFRKSYQIFPIDIQLLGHTSKSQIEFEAWCRQVTVDRLYSRSNYDLFKRNCNNFSHDAALQGLGLTRGVPFWILEVPQRFLSSPLGQMIRPMMERMQISGQGSNRGDTFSSSQHRASPSHDLNSSSSRPSTAVPVSATHPMSGLDSTRNNITVCSDNSSLIANNRTSQSFDVRQVATPVIDSHNRMLISNDRNMVPICVTKLAGSSLCDSKCVTLLQVLGSELKASSIATLSTKDLDYCITILCLLLDTAERTYSLLLLRLLVLVQTEHQLRIVVKVSQYLYHESEMNSKAAMTSYSMAWCVVSNAVGSWTSNSFEETMLSKLIDQGFKVLSSSNNKNELRQSVSAFLYNSSCYVSKHYCSAHLNGSDYFLHDIAISLLCGSIDGISTEPDTTTKFRRLLIVGRILCPSKDDVSSDNTHFSMTRDLLNDLSFGDVLADLSKNADRNSLSSETKAVIDICHELSRLLS